MQKECRNPGDAPTPIWTCPGCYTDHEREVTKCDGCGRALECSTDYEPVTVCRLAPEEPPEEVEDQRLRRYGPGYSPNDLGQPTYHGQPIEGDQ